MEGLRRRRKSALEVEREFVRSRLEPQILVRVYELVVPVICRNLTGEQLTGAKKDGSQERKKGA